MHSWCNNLESLSLMAVAALNVYGSPWPCPQRTLLAMPASVLSCSSAKRLGRSSAIPMVLGAVPSRRMAWARPYSPADSKAWIRVPRVQQSYCCSPWLWFRRP